MKTFLFTVLLFTCPSPALPALQGGSQRQPAAEWPAADTLPDGELERRFDGLISGDAHTRELDVDHAIESCLLEMVRRGGTRWSGVVERARTQWLELQGQASEVGSMSPLARRGDLELWIAQRRLERRPDPVRLVLRDEGPVLVPFPTLPKIAFAIVLAEGETARPTLARGGSYRSGRFERCRVESAPGEATVAPRQWFQAIGGGTLSRVQLEPGDEIAYEIDSGDFLSPESPGPFRLRVRYHDSWGIAAAEVDLEQRLTVDSAPFDLRWTPLVLAREDVERADVATWLAALDERAPVPIARTVWRPGARCVLDSSRPERDLLQSGWNALPGLLQALEDCEATPNRRAWHLALLFDLTGAVDPRAHPGAIGRFHEKAVFEHEASPESPWRQGSDSFGENVEPSTEVQAQLAERWAALSRLVVVE